MTDVLLSALRKVHTSDCNYATSSHNCKVTAEVGWRHGQGEGFDLDGRDGSPDAGHGRGARGRAQRLDPWPAFLSRISSRRPIVLSRISPAVRLRHFLPANISFRRDTQR
jgi:hypothetical protein